MIIAIVSKSDAISSFLEDTHLYKYMIGLDVLSNNGASKIVIIQMFVLMQKCSFLYQTIVKQFALFILNEMFEF